MKGKWVIVCVYTIGIFVVTPYLPQLIQIATSRWSSSGVSRFVLGIEIAIALLILTLAIGFLIHRRKKSALFLISVGGIFLLSFIIYRFIPNPYEFTHLPEYAILSMLIVWALDKGKGKSIAINKDTARCIKKVKEEEKNIKYAIIKNPYFFSGILTSIIGTTDEIYQYFLPNRFFTLYDIFLNILGGILGLLIYWGYKKS